MGKKKGPIRKFMSEFKTFITRGNVLDMAVGVIVGGAFTGIVNGLSNYILKPLINYLIAVLLGGNALEGAVTILGKPAYLEDGVTVDLANSIYIDWGAFISAIINFLLIAFVLFTIVRIINNINAARDRAEEQVAGKRALRKAVKKVQKQEKVTKQEAKAIYEARVAEAAAAKAAEAEAAAKAEAEAAELAAKLAEEKAMANTVLLQEILAVLKSKS